MFLADIHSGCSSNLVCVCPVNRLTNVRLLASTSILALQHTAMAKIDVVHSTQATPLCATQYLLWPLFSTKEYQRKWGNSGARCTKWPHLPCQITVSQQISMEAMYTLEECCLLSKSVLCEVEVLYFSPSVLRSDFFQGHLQINDLSGVSLSVCPFSFFPTTLGLLRDDDPCLTRTNLFLSHTLVYR